MVRHTKFQIAIIAVIVLIIPTIIVFQLTKADINISDLTFPINPTFKNQCFLGETECRYISNLGVIDFKETDTNWQILGENVWCIKTERTVAVPVSDPVGEITQESEVTCNNIAIFDKDEWDFGIIQAELSGGRESQTFIFTMKGQ